MVTPAVLKLYCDLKGIFSEEKANELPVSSSYNHEIKLERDCQPPYSLIYPLSTPKLHVLREYLHDNLAKEFIQHSTSSASAPVTGQTASTDRSRGHTASQLTSHHFLMFSPIIVAILFCSFTFLYDRNLLIVINIQPLTLGKAQPWLDSPLPKQNRRHSAIGLLCTQAQVKNPSNWLDSPYYQNNRTDRLKPKI